MVSKRAFDTALLEDMAQAITDIPVLNKHVQDWVERRMGLSAGTDPNLLGEVRAEYYWELYALRTKELVIATLAQL